MGRGQGSNRISANRSCPRNLIDGLLQRRVNLTRCLSTFQVPFGALDIGVQLTFVALGR